MLRVAVAHQRDAVMITEGKASRPGGRRILFVNPAFTTLTGFSAAEAIGRTPNLTIGPESEPSAIAAIGQAIEAARPVRQEILKYRKDGTTFWAEVDIAPVSSDGEETKYLVCVMRDVTERRQQAELLRIQSERLAEALSAKSAFLANVSHELRTPLNAILGYTSMLEYGVYGDLTEGQRHSMGRVTRNAQHLLALITDILDLSRMESGRMPVHRTSFDLKQLVTEVLADLEPITKRTKLSVTVRARRGPFVVDTDRQRLRQVLVNLLSNALKFTLEGWVRVSLRERHGNVWITVADSGVGIPRSARREIFEDFRQVHSSSALGGTGLGLAICKRLASLLGGDIRVESIVGKGSRFTVCLPMAIARPSAKTRQRPARQRPPLQKAS